MSISNTNQMFSVGDKVKVHLTLDAFQKLQEGHGGWNQKMADVCFLD
jgi:hypothetical protein